LPEYVFTFKVGDIIAMEKVTHVKGIRPLRDITDAVLYARRLADQRGWTLISVKETRRVLAKR